MRDHKWLDIVNFEKQMKISSKLLERESYECKLWNWQCCKSRDYKKESGEVVDKSNIPTWGSSQCAPRQQKSRRLNQKYLEQPAKGMHFTEREDLVMFRTGATWWTQDGHQNVDTKYPPRQNLLPQRFLHLKCTKQTKWSDYKNGHYTAHRAVVSSVSSF